MDLKFDRGVSGYFLAGDELRIRRSQRRSASYLFTFFAPLQHQDGRLTNLGLNWSWRTEDNQTREVLALNPRVSRAAELPATRGLIETAVDQYKFE